MEMVVMKILRFRSIERRHVHKRPPIVKRIRRGLHWVGSTSPGTTGFDVVGS
jgi:hypothetical protein